MLTFCLMVPPLASSIFKKTNDLAEVDNAVNGTMREIANRYDFKGSKSEISRLENEITLIAEDNYKIDQIFYYLQYYFLVNLKKVLY